MTDGGSAPALDDRVAANRRRAGLLLGAAAGAVTVVLWMVGLLLGAPLVGLLVAVAVSLVVTGTAYATGDTLALALTRARPADAVEHARLYNVVEGLCFSSGLPKPSVHVVADDALNAFAAGRGPKRAAVVVTTGLLRELSRVEIEGVVAHELSHVKSHDVLVSTLAVPLVALPASLLPAPACAHLVGAVVGSRRELLADVTGVSLTRYPPGLISALEKLRHGPVAVGAGGRATAHLWIEPPVTGVPVVTHPPLAERIEALQEL